MDNKDGRKKESIDEILSDLNGLLNKMPSILDGIRMPEIKPAEFPSEPVYRRADAPAASPVPAHEPRPADQPPFEAPAKAEPAPADADKTMVLPAFSELSEGAEAPAQEKLVPQSLGDFMFGEKAGEAKESPVSPAPAKLSGAPLEPPEELPAPDRSGEEKGGLVITPFNAPEEEKSPEAQLPRASLEPLEPAEEDNFSLQDALPPAGAPEPAIPEVSFPEEYVPVPAPAAGTPEKYNVTGDFGVPDIDAMLLMSTDEKPAADQEPAPARQPEPEPAAQIPLAEASAPASTEPAIAEPGADELAEFERQLKAASPQGDAMENKPEDANKDIQGEAAPETRPEGLVLEPAAAPPPAEELPAQVPQPAQPAGPAQPQTGEIELSVNAQEPAARPQGEMNLFVNEPAPEAKPEGGMVLEPAGAPLSDQPKADAGDETLVVPASSGDGDKTVVFEAGTMPGITSRSQASDLDSLAKKPVPEGIPSERVRSVVFLYAAEEKAFCASVLSEIDAICLRSADKPMFVKRALVRECDPEINGNYVLQIVADSSAQGLVCIGNIPQEKVFEIESAFTSSGKFFRHYDSAGFSHSVALDLVADLILC